jgi:hypothetical protein
VIPDTSQMLRVDKLRDREVDRADELLEMAEYAKAYVLLENGVRGIRRCFLDRGIAPMLAVFYCELNAITTSSGAWVVVGDIPPARIDATGIPDGKAALNWYVSEMRRWVAAVKGGEPVAGLVPVRYRRSRELLPDTDETAKMLDRRLDTIVSTLIPWFEGGRWAEGGLED